MNIDKEIKQDVLIEQPPYQLRIDDITVHFEYSNNSKSMEDCIRNILNTKLK